jgi:hypothetical protein
MHFFSINCSMHRELAEGNKRLKTQQTVLRALYTYIVLCICSIDIFGGNRIRYIRATQN